MKSFSIKIILIVSFTMYFATFALGQNCNSYINAQVDNTVTGTINGGTRNYKPSSYYTILQAHNLTLNNGARVKLTGGNETLLSGNIVVKNGSVLVVEGASVNHNFATVRVENGSKLIILCTAGSNNGYDINFVNTDYYVYDNSHLRIYSCGNITCNTANFDVGRCIVLPSGATDCLGQNTTVNNNDKSKMVMYASGRINLYYGGSMERRSKANIVKRANFIVFGFLNDLTYDIPRAYVPNTDGVERGVYAAAEVMSLTGAVDLFDPIVSNSGYLVALEGSLNFLRLVTITNVQPGTYCPVRCGENNVDWDYAIYESDKNLDHVYSFSEGSSSSLLGAGDNDLSETTHKYVADYITNQPSSYFTPAELSASATAQQGKMKLSPNPFDGEAMTIALELPIETPLIIQVFDNLGREVAREAFPLSPSGAWSWVWHPKVDLQAGMYFVTATLQDGTRYTERLVKH